MLPIEGIDWQSIHETVNGTRIVLMRDHLKRYGVIIFDPQNNLHQLPIIGDERKAIKVYWQCVTELR